MDCIFLLCAIRNSTCSTLLFSPFNLFGAPRMKHIAGQASLAINKAVDWSQRTIHKSKQWFESQRLKYSDREFTPRPKRLEDEEAPGRFKRFWYAFRIAKRLYPSTVSVPATTAAPLASTAITHTILCRSVSPRLHALTRFRAAMRIGAAAAAEQHAVVCKHEGWDDEQMNAAA